MPITITARMSDTDLRRISRKYRQIADEVDAAIAGAVNDVAEDARAEMRRRVRGYLNLDRDRINDAIEVERRATASNPTALVVIDSLKRNQRPRPTLMRFAGRPKKPYAKSASKRKRKRPPFTYQILKAGPRKVLPGGFVQLGKEFASGGIGSSRVTGRPQAFFRAGRERYPLIAPRGPSVAYVWRDKDSGLAEEVLPDISLRLAKRINGRLKAALAKKLKQLEG